MVGSGEAYEDVERGHELANLFNLLAVQNYYDLRIQLGGLKKVICLVGKDRKETEECLVEEIKGILEWIQELEHMLNKTARDRYVWRPLVIMEAFGIESLVL